MIVVVELQNGIHAEVIGEVKNHAYGNTRRWKIDLLQKGRRKVLGRGPNAERAATRATSVIVGDNEIVRWVQGFPPPKKMFKPFMRKKKNLNTNER
jgi:hypothetical protein